MLLEIDDETYDVATAPEAVRAKFALPLAWYGTTRPAPWAHTPCRVMWRVGGFYEDDFYIPERYYEQKLGDESAYEPVIPLWQIVERVAACFGLRATAYCCTGYVELRLGTPHGRMMSPVLIYDFMTRQNYLEGRDIALDQVETTLTAVLEKIDVVRSYRQAKARQVFDASLNARLEQEGVPISSPASDEPVVCFMQLYDQLRTRVDTLLALTLLPTRGSLGADLDQLRDHIAFAPQGLGAQQAAVLFATQHE